MEVPPGPLEVGMEVTGLGCSGAGGWGEQCRQKTGRRPGLLSCWLWAASGQVRAQCCQERDPGLWVAQWPDKALITERK